MVTVDQNFTITPTSIEREMPAFIFGPNYELHRYEDDAEKPKSFVGHYEYDPSDTPMQFPYPNAIDEEAVDKDYTKLYGDNVVVDLDDPVTVDSVGLKNLPETSMKATTLTFSRFSDYDVKVGSQLLVHFRNNDEADGSGSDDSGSGEDRPVKRGTDPSIDDVITRVVAYERIVEKSGSGSSAESTVKIVAYVDDTFPQYDETSMTIQLTPIAVVSGVEFKRRDPYTPNKYQWEQPVDKMLDEETDTWFYGVKVNNDLFAYLNLNDTYGDDKTECYPVRSADLYVSFRELITTYSDTLHSIVGASEVANALGVVHPDNPLAMGVYMAALNAATDDGDEAPPVYFMGVSVDENGKLDYAEVLNRASLTDRVYILAPTTRDETVIELVRNHVLEMSQKTVKQWRIAAVSMPIPDKVDRLSRLLDNQGDDFYCKIIDKKTIRCVKDEDSDKGNPDTRFRSTIVPGDKVRFDIHLNEWGDLTWTTLTVRRVVNNYTLEVKEEDVLQDRIDRDDTLARITEVYHEYTHAEEAEVIASLSKSLASRRVLNVYPSIFGNDGVIMTGEFAACAVAGLISATEPQQPITNVSVRGIDDIPLVYQSYSKAELDVIASGGTFIVCHDLPHDKVYVRHKITTAYPDGNLNTAEMSITKNVDNISYKFAEVFRPYYGKYNIVPGFLAKLESVALSLIKQLSNGTSIYGPQLIDEETVLQYVRQNELMKDHVDIGVRLGVPYPCNNIDIVLTV